MVFGALPLVLIIVSMDTGKFSGLTKHTKSEKKPEMITANEVIDRIKSNVNCPWREKTVDTFKSGNPGDEVTGVVVTFLATMDVLKNAQKLGYNLIITHEPTFYDHFDNNPAFENDPVMIQKKKFIEDNDLIVWRFHDHWHDTHPDGIYVGMNSFLEWESFKTQGTERYYSFPEQTLKAFVYDLTGKFENITVRVVGDPQMRFTKAGIILGAPGAVPQIKMLEEESVEVLIAGETNEWETVEYVRDAVAQNRNKALILLGHLNSEEEGMRYCAEWLQTFVNEVPVAFIPSHDPFWTVHD